MDVHIPYAITTGLRLRGLNVLTAQHDNTTELADPELLDRATALGRVLLTRDHDLLREANQRQQKAEDFAGVIYAHQLRITIEQCIADLELIAQAYEPEDPANRVEYLPLK
ncbi:MAG: DUF5615 family PIN-like protein [Pyrinomonadaceae bacterium]